METSRTRRWLDQLLHTHDTPERTALAYALGVFFGFSPMLGLHTVLGLVFAFAFNLNRVAVLLGIYSNLPWILPAYYSLATLLGAAILRVKVPPNLLRDLQAALAQASWADFRAARSRPDPARLGLRPRLHHRRRHPGVDRLSRVPGDDHCAPAPDRTRQASQIESTTYKNGPMRFGPLTEGRSAPIVVAGQPVCGLRTMLISRSLGRKLSATAIVAVGFVLMYEAKVMDFLDIPRLIQSPSAAEEISIPSQSNHLRFTATAYCKGTTTASGVNVRTGIAAADPDLLPVGSVIQVYKLGERYNGIYTIMDTGPGRPGAPHRHLHVELQRGAGARPPRHRHQRPAPRLEPQGQHADARRAPLPPARSRPARRAAAPLPSRPIEIR